MNLVTIQGDLLETQCEVIGHVVNSQGRMGSGVAKAIKEKWPEVYEDYYHSWKALDGNIFSGTLLSETHDGKYVANICAQYYYRGCDSDYKMCLGVPWAFSADIKDHISGWCEAGRFLNYEALYRCLEKLKVDMIQKDLHTLAFPYKMGADRAGGDWNVVVAMINSVFDDTNFYIEIRKL